MLISGFGDGGKILISILQSATREKRDMDEVMWITPAREEAYRKSVIYVTFNSKNLSMRRLPNLVGVIYLRAG